MCHLWTLDVKSWTSELRRKQGNMQVNLAMTQDFCLWSTSLKAFNETLLTLFGPYIMVFLLGAMVGAGLALGPFVNQVFLYLVTPILKFLAMHWWTVMVPITSWFLISVMLVTMDKKDEHVHCQVRRQWIAQHHCNQKKVGCVNGGSIKNHKFHRAYPLDLREMGHYIRKNSAPKHEDQEALAIARLACNTLAKMAKDYIVFKSRMGNIKADGKPL